MSGRSGSVRSCAGSVRLGPGPHDFVLDALYERKRDNKSVRVLTVVIYVFCVSLAAIMLSLYYVFFWEPKDTQRKVSHTVDQQTSTTPMPTCFMSHTGGSHTAVTEESLTTPLLVNISVSSPAPSEDPQASTAPPSELPTSLEPTTSDGIGHPISLNDTMPT